MVVYLKILLTGTFEFIHLQEKAKERMFREEMEKELTEKDGQLHELINRHKDVSIYILNIKNVKLYLILKSPNQY